MSTVDEKFNMILQVCCTLVYPPVSRKHLKISTNFSPFLLSTVSSEQSRISINCSIGVFKYV